MTAAPALLVENAAIVAVDDAFTVHPEGWLAVAADGTIAGLGPGSAPADLAAAPVERRDFGGDILMPGMVNTHCHMAMSLFRGLGDDEPDRLERYIFPLEARFVTPEMVRLGSLHAAIELVEGGVTTVADMYYFEAEAARACAAVGLRGVLGQTFMARPLPDAADAMESEARFADLAGACTADDRLTPSRAPHAPHTCGLDLLGRIAERAAGDRWPIQIHMAEVPAEIDWARAAHGTGPVGLLDRAGLLSPRLIGAHGLLLTEAEIARLAETGAAVAHCPGSNAKAGKGIAPVAALRAAGVPVGLGSDGAMSGNTLDLFAQLPQAAKLAKLRAGDRRVMPAREVLGLATREGARALGLGEKTGSLEPGKAADMIRVAAAAPRMRPRHDLASLLVYSAAAGDVREVWIAGRAVVCDGRAVFADRDAALAEADRFAARMAAAVA